jgi:hypothetical protein
MVRAAFDATGRVLVGPHAVWVAESVLVLGRVRPPGARLEVHGVWIGRRNRVAVDELAVGGGRVWIYGDIAAPASDPRAGREASC